MPLVLIPSLYISEGENKQKLKQPETSAQSPQLFIASSLPAGARVASTPHNFLSLCEPSEADLCCAAVSVWEQHREGAG